MSTVGPVCHIPPVKPDTLQPKPHNMPSIPPAQPNLQSLTNTVNTMRTLLIQLLSRKAVWVETGRVTELVRVFNPNDHTQYVDVERINQLVMADKVTGQVWEWNRNRAAS